MPKHKATIQKTAENKKIAETTIQQNQTDISKTATDPELPEIPIVGIGASAGGLEALDVLLQHMPADTGLAFVIVTHQHPGHTSLLAELLSRQTSMPVVEVTDGTKVKANHVYVATPGGLLAILNGTLHRMDTGNLESPRLPIDYFFRSLAEDRKQRAICIILSGTGTDGTLGLKAIKEASGMAMVEEPKSAKYAGMPASAISTGLADYVLSPADMPGQLVAYSAGPFLTRKNLTLPVPHVPAEPLQKIFLLLRNRTGHDFSSYKINTLHRRIERRMNIHQIEIADDYVRFLQENPHEIDILFRELLISVTQYFRDKEAWIELGEHLQKLVSSTPENSVIRAWIPGCATGEEVFSLAIVLRECIRQTEQHINVQIFGTDLDAVAIETARLGQYADGIAADVSPERLERFFTHHEDSYRIRKEIREMTIFAPQNMITDPPFTKLDILSCRNLLIYLNADLQKKILPIFHYALKPGGILFLGPSETIGPFTDLFEPLSKRWKIFRRKETVGANSSLPEVLNRSSMNEQKVTPMMAPVPPTMETRITVAIERFLLGRFAPASVVVNDLGNIVFIHGRTGMYLEPSEGEPRHNLLEMAREGLKTTLSAALHKCITSGTDVIEEGVRVNSNDAFILVDFSVSKLHDSATLQGLFLVSFLPASVVSPDISKKKKTRRKGTKKEMSIEHLEQELQFTRESHQRTQNELQTSNEELKSTNEELQSINEELQSSNEELETSKEEMQSLNEELTTVNSELQSKLDELSHANDDMQNLLNSTDVATVFLDKDLNIRRYTEQAKELVMLRDNDIGRPISELASNIEHDDLVEKCRDVLRTLKYVECEVRTNNGGWYQLRITPYRTTENLIDGLVITFVNIRSSGELRAFFESIVETVHHPLIVLNDNRKIISANHCFFETFKLSQSDVINSSLSDIGNGEWNNPELQSSLDRIFTENTSFENFRLEQDFTGAGHKVLLLNARRLNREQGMPDMVLLAMEALSQ
ncbi:chemotaxis protein CheB [Gimesia sp.]|uniref:chemotaxis protein CheB n=1 Tax=Gimesia sp. TaxID=2024833 RepID=UPI003A90FC6B